MQRISARFAMVTSAAFSLNLLRGRRMHLGAFLLVLGNLVLASIYSAQLPILEGQDEHEHVAVVEYIVRTGTYPVVGPGAPIQAYHPPLYYALMAVLAKPAPRVDELHRNPAWGYDLYRPGNDNKNQFVHTNAEEFPYAGSALTVHVLRIATAMMAAGMAALTFATAQEIFPGAAFEALASAALVAFLPAWLASSSSVGNDALAGALGALHIYIAVRALTRNTSWRLVIALGIATGLLWLTKLSATIVVPIAWAAVALGRSDKHRRYGDIARRVGVLLAVALTLSGWWFVRSYTLYGDVTAVSAVDRLIGVTGWNWQGWRWYADVLLQLVQDFWLRFSLGTVVAPAAVYLVLAGLSMLSIVGGGRWLWRRAWKPAGPPLSAMIALGLFATTASVAALAYPLINIHGSQGRLFFFPALPAFAILLTVGWRELLPHRAWTKWTFGVYIAAIVGVALYAWLGVLRPAYHPPRMLNPQQLPTNLARQDEAFGNLATLVGVSLPAARVSPGDEISVTPCWQVNATTTQNLREFVQIVRLSDAVKIGARDTYPGLGHYPTSRWRRGDLFCDPIPVRIVDDIPTPGVYSVLVGLYSDDPNAAFAHTVTAGDVVVGPSQVDVTGLTLLHARYENAVELVGYKRNGLELMLYWRVLGKPPADMSLFTHLFDAAAQPIVLSDGAPLSGQFPAPVWEVGDVFVETRTFAPPKGHAAGPSSWQVGWYWRSSGQRLRVEIDGNRLRDDVVVIPGPQLP